MTLISDEIVEWGAFVDANESFKNVKKIFPTQQKDVNKIVDIIKDIPSITKAIIFGSSITGSCNPWSDIDLYLETTEKTIVTFTYPKVEAVVDKWTNYEVDDDLMQEINNKGVLIYERKK